MNIKKNHFWKGLFIFVLAFGVLNGVNAQVFIEGVNFGNNFVDTPGTIYTNSPATIIRATGASVTYDGQNISGSTAAGANEFMGIQAQNGAQVTLAGTSAFTVSNAYGFSVDTAASIIATGTTNITSKSIGVLVNDATATLNGLSVINSGSGGSANTWIHGVNVTGTGAGQVELSGSTTITVDSVAGSGVRVDGTGSTAVLNDSVDIAITNPTNTGINNVNEAAALYANGGFIEVTASPVILDAMQGRGYGLWAGANTTSEISIVGNTLIATHGMQGLGVRLDNGAIALNGALSIITGVDPAPSANNGEGSAGLRGILGAMNVSGATSVQTVGGIASVGNIFTSTKESAYGLWNTSHSRLAGDGAVLYFGGPVTIKTIAPAAHGIYNDSRSGMFTFANAVDVTTTGSTGSVTWYRASLTSSGTNETVGAWGVNSAISGTTTFRGALTVSTTGNSSGGIRSIGGTIDAQSDVNVTTLATNAYGIWASSATAGGRTYNGAINIAGRANITTHGAGAHNVFANANGNVQLTGGALLRLADATAKGILASGNSTITGSGRFDVIADLQSSANAQMDLSMNASSIFTGATARTDASVFNLTLSQNSVWDMTESSTLTLLENSASKVNFLPPNGGVFKTLTTVNYVGDRGTIGLNTFLGDDASPSDTLVIDGGTAIGTTVLNITNAGGPGAQTTGNGILVVDAQNGATTAANAFTLAGGLIMVGGYQYSLHRGSEDASAPESWFLRSAPGQTPHVTPPAAQGIPALNPITLVLLALVLGVAGFRNQGLGIRKN